MTTTVSPAATNTSLPWALSSASLPSPTNPSVVGTNASSIQTIDISAILAHIPADTTITDVNDLSFATALNNAVTFDDITQREARDLASKNANQVANPTSTLALTQQDIANILRGMAGTI